MIGEDVIRRARAWAKHWLGAGATRPAQEALAEANDLLLMLADACEAENARRALLAKAGLPATRAGLTEEKSLAELRRISTSGPTDTTVCSMVRYEFRDVVAVIDRQQARIEALEALLMDAEDTLRARAEGRRAGLLAAAALCQDRMEGQSATFLGGFLAGLRDKLRRMALPAPGQAEQEGRAEA